MTNSSLLITVFDPLCFTGCVAIGPMTVTRDREVYHDLKEHRYLATGLDNGRNMYRFSEDADRRTSVRMPCCITFAKPSSLSHLPSWPSRCSIKIRRIS